MKNNAIMNGLQTFGTAIASGCKKHAGLLIATVNIASTCVLIYEVWTRKEKIQKAIEDTKDAPLKEKVKVVGKEVAPVIIPAAMSSGSAIAGAVVIKNAAKTVADMTVKTSEIVDVANNAIDAKDQYQKATKEVVGEDKEKEIREKVAQEEEKNRKVLREAANYGAGFDVYYDSTNPGYEFNFNEDRVKRLEDDINKVTCGSCPESASLDIAYNAIEDIAENVVMDRPSTSDDMGWPAGTKVSVRGEWAGMRNGRALFKITYDPAPTFLYGYGHEY